ncbi:hypothetical protein GLOIN_2v1776151 [Rhizophagus clarus]|uniref:Uncharacterized protein n=1 Tax=Rhizophagus clarus TaxID=94130 RepID=A0A8H3R4N6_9GLOM|nr:hypothetical protein GLOIN_2v1776151 [Rhizophagus clarus]
MIISGIVTAALRTINHMIIYLIMNVSFIVIFFVLNFYGVFLSDDHVYHISRVYMYLNLAFCICFFIISVIIIESRFKTSCSSEISTKDREIQRIYKWYCLQKTLCHAQIIVALFLHFSYSYAFIPTKTGLFSFIKIIPWPNASLCIIAYTMIKGVRMESNCTMFVFYIFNFMLYGFYIYILISGLFIGKLADNYSIKPFLIIPLCITLVTIVNSIICQRNFGKGLKIYLNYEPNTIEELIVYNSDINQRYKDDVETDSII